MKNILPIIHEVRSYASRLHITRFEHILIRVIVVLCILNVVGAALAFRVHFHQIPIVQATAEHEIEQLGTTTISFINELRSHNLHPQPITSVTRARFSLPGTIVALEDDNIQVFEYPNGALTKNKDIDTLVAYYYTDTPEDSWKNNVHVFSKDSLLIFYLGTNERILSALASTTNSSHIQHLIAASN